VGLGLLHGFATVNFSGVGLLMTPPTPNFKDQGLHFVWPLLFDSCDMGGPTRILRSASTALRVTGALKPPLHCKAVILEQDEGHIICKVAKNIRVLGCTWTYTPLEYTKLSCCMEGEMWTSISFLVSFISPLQSSTLRKQRSGAWLPEEGKCNFKYKQIEQLTE
jgi:hypothetical protein